MKKLIIIALLFAATINAAYSQLRKQFTETRTNDAVIITAPTPAFMDKDYDMQFTLNKIFLADNSIQYVLQAGRIAIGELSDVPIEIGFRDGEVLILENATYQPEYIQKSFEPSSDYIPTVVLSPAIVEKLRTKKISYFMVDGFCASYLVATSFADRIRRYTNYLVGIQRQKQNDEVIPSLQINQSLVIIK